MLFAILTASALSFYLHLPPEVRALNYLAREVPRWSPANKCYSCHNNGDAARALYQAERLGYRLPKRSLSDTTAWLAKPARWEHNGGDQRFSDKKLAALQFAAALVEAVETHIVTDAVQLTLAADKIAALQHKDGSWKLDDQAGLGSPITYGTCLTTCTGRRVLAKADARRHAGAIARADRWLEQTTPKTVPDAAAVLLALCGNRSAVAGRQRDRCLDVIRLAENRAGGWGPDNRSRPEPFDTALVVIALASYPEVPDAGKLIERGRAYLTATQELDGGWPETTRPAGAVSYAHRISTTGWATQALLTTRPAR